MTSPCVGIHQIRSGLNLITPIVAVGLYSVQFDLGIITFLLFPEIWNVTLKDGQLLSKSPMEQVRTC